MVIDTNRESERFVDNFDRRLMMLCESGSATYGFKSDRSDLDLRGVYVEDIENVLSLRPRKDVIDGFSDNREVDWQVFELKKFLSLLVKPNFNVFEWVYTPLQFMEFPKEIRRIADMALSQKIGSHVRGWAYHLYRMNWDDPKKCIYAIRPLMSYINLCERREFVSDITLLAPKFGFEEHVETLIKLYAEGSNTGDIVRERNVEIYDGLAFLSNQVEKDSWLPEETSVDAIDAANDFLVKTRFEGFSDKNNSDM